MNENDTKLETKVVEKPENEVINQVEKTVISELPLIDAPMPPDDYQSEQASQQSSSGHQSTAESPKLAPQKSSPQAAPRRPRPVVHSDARQRSSEQQQYQGDDRRAPSDSKSGVRGSSQHHDEQAPTERHQQQQRYHQDGRSARDTMSHPVRTLEELSLSELNGYSRRYGILGAGLMSKEMLLSKIRFAEANPDIEMEVEGVLEKLPDGFGFLRSAAYDYVAGPDDVYVSPSQIRRFGLRTGDTVHGVIRKPKEGEKYFALLKVDTVNGLSPAAAYDRPNFDRLTPMHPNKKFTLEFEPTAIATRIMDMFTPIGKGQRGLIVAPPKVGKTLLLKEIAQSLMVSYPEVKLIVLCIDERPEEVADMKRIVRGTSAQVISSTFDEPAVRHTQVAEMVLEQSKRLVESGRDVVILLDSITRLARAYNTNAPSSGKVLTGGIDAHALQWPKRFFGAARCTEEGGSLTIIASALVETGSRMDEVIYEEFKGTGNMEIHMTRKLSNRRTYPAFDLPMSGTRRDDLLLIEEELNKVWVMQKFLSTMNVVEGMEFLIDKMKKFKTNREFLDSINKKSPDKPVA